MGREADVGEMIVGNGKRRKFVAGSDMGFRSFLFSMVALSLLPSCSMDEPRACKPPRAYWHKRGGGIGLEPIYNKVSLRHDDRLFWNGQFVTETQFDSLAKSSHRLSPEPDLILEAEMGVSCRALESVRDRMDKALACKTGYARCIESPSNIPEP